MLALSVVTTVDWGAAGGWHVAVGLVVGHYPREPVLVAESKNGVTG